MILNAGKYRETTEVGLTVAAFDSHVPMMIHVICTCDTRYMNESFKLYK